MPAVSMMAPAAQPPGIEGRTICTDDQIEQACEIAQTHGAYHLRSIRELIKRTAPKQNQFEFIERHPIILRIDEYGTLVRQALRGEPAPRAFTEEEPTPLVLPHGFPRHR